MKTFTYEFTAFNPAFAGCDNETIYDGLCAATTPLDAGLAELHARLKPIIVNAAQGFLRALTWTLDDAVGDALVLLWELVKKHTYKRSGAPFHNFFGSCWRQRLNRLFEHEILKNPVNVGNIRIGWCHDEPIYAAAYAEHPKAAEYRKKHKEHCRNYHARKAAEQGKEYKPRTGRMSDAERRERSRLRQAARFQAMTPEEKAAMYAKSNAQRRAKRAAERAERERAGNR